MRLAQKQCLRTFVTFFKPFYELFCQSFGHKTFKTTCLWSLVVVLEWDSILQERGKWSGAKKSVPIGRNISKKGVGSKCALCLQRVITSSHSVIFLFRHLAARLSQSQNGGNPEDTVNLQLRADRIVHANTIWLESNRI